MVFLYCIKVLAKTQIFYTESCSLALAGKNVSSINEDKKRYLFYPTYFIAMRALV